MGGSDSIEFMVQAPSGEDDVMLCSSCGYAANIEKAISRVDEVIDSVGPEVPEKFATPGIRTIAALADAGYPANAQIKTMVFVIDGQVTLALVVAIISLMSKSLQMQRKRTLFVQLGEKKQSRVLELNLVPWRCQRG